MKVIYKYEYGPEVCTTIKLPVNFKIIRVAHQNSRYGKGLMLWAEIDADEQESIPVHFEWFNTGEAITDKIMNYVASLENNNGQIMHLYHSYDRSKKSPG